MRKTSIRLGRSPIRLPLTVILMSTRWGGVGLIIKAGRPEAVLFSISEYSRLVKRKEKTSFELADLRRRFDVGLAGLREADAGDRLRASMDEPGQLAGRVKGGGRTSHGVPQV